MNDGCKICFVLFLFLHSASLYYPTHSLIHPLIHPLIPPPLSPFLSPKEDIIQLIRKYKGEEGGGGV